jgi:hypothetical protein
VIFSTAVCANLIGLNISAASNTVVAAYVSIPFILVPQLLLSGVVVDFNKIHKKITSVQYTPVYGDLMTSRWAYEALVVEQFKKNRFQRHFYQTDKVLSQNNFMLTFYIEKLRTIFSNQLISSNIDTVQNENNYFELLKNELSKLSKTYRSEQFSYLSDNLKENYTDTLFQASFYSELDKLRSRLLAEQREYNHRRDLKYNQLVNNLGGVDKFTRFKQRYHNQSISDMVQNKHSFKKIAIENNHILQLKDPVYRNPVSTIGRAHFYSPVKIAGPLVIDTYWFNLMIIWLMTGIMYIILQLDILRKATDYMQVLKVTYGWSKKVLRM